MQLILNKLGLTIGLLKKIPSEIHQRERVVAKKSAEKQLQAYYENKERKGLTLSQEDRENKRLYDCYCYIYDRLYLNEIYVDPTLRITDTTGQWPEMILLGLLMNPQRVAVTSDFHKFLLDKRGRKLMRELCKYRNLSYEELYQSMIENTQDTFRRIYAFYSSAHSCFNDLLWEDTASMDRRTETRIPNLDPAG